MEKAKNEFDSINETLEYNLALKMLDKMKIPTEHQGVKLSLSGRIDLAIKDRR